MICAPRSSTATQFGASAWIAYVMPFCSNACSTGRCNVVRSVMIVMTVSSEATRFTLLRRQSLEAGRPPPGLDRFDELGRQFLLGHLARERGVVVFDGDEFDAQFPAERQHRVPNIRPP